MQNHKRLQKRYFLRNANHLMLKYKKIFVYYYQHSRWNPPDPVPPHNLQQIGCVYQGWFEVGFNCVAEVWRYPSPKHRILIEMSLPINNVIWHQDWGNHNKRLRKNKNQLDDYIRKMILKAHRLSRVIP